MSPRRPDWRSQCEKILRVLESGPVTAAGIHRIAGSSRLNSRISELRKRGYAITCEHVPGASGPEAYVYTLHESAESDLDTSGVPALFPPSALSDSAEQLELVSA